ncbi:conserved hypothetical protein [Acidithiobacillus caldus SM-1]|uniref:Uncharacterized protein n=2 Tax=Acidithiobacillus caldus TaxID=33059 RepID=F9ZN37_ACICS|nr:conserved hypothetical protein [Acidithiobacillus caldus SM-1]QER43118.1 hypothetical protein F0726_00026 [Acidithiobacillus caldus]
MYGIDGWPDDDDEGMVHSHCTASRVEIYVIRE